MYTNNLPDGVVIPDALVSLVEAGAMDEHARGTVAAWVQDNRSISRDLKDFWLDHVGNNIKLCKTYGIPECVTLFSYVIQLMETQW